MQNLIDKALLAIKESKHIEFKSNFEIDNNRDWCEILKDIFALVNSGGGVILIGVDNNGVPLGTDISKLIKMDPAIFINKIYSYSGSNFIDFELLTKSKSGKEIFVIHILPTKNLLIPIRPGTYELNSKNQKNVFSVGIVFYRHGAISAPATSEDLNSIIERKLSEIRKEWFSNVKKVVRAPSGSIVQMISKDVRVTQDKNALPVRITDDPNAPEYKLVDPDITHPYRLKEIVKYINSKLEEKGLKITQHDIKVALTVYKLDNSINIIYKGKYSPKKYSEEFASWIIEHITRDKYFFKLARSKYKRMSLPRKRKQIVIEDEDTRVAPIDW